MANSQDSPARQLHPYKQAIFALGAILLITIGGIAMNAIGIVDVSERFAWLCSASFMLVFSVFNSMLSLFSKNLNIYWSASIPSFMVLAALAALSAYFFSGVAISDAGSYRWIFIVVSIGYLVFMSMMRITRNIVEFAEREEWNAPKRRK